MEQTSGEKKTVRRYRGEGLVSFLANLDSIRREVEAGWPLQAVYDRHQDRLSIQYMQFHRYVTKYVKGQTPPQKSKSAVSQKADPLAKELPEPVKRLNDPTPLSDSELF